MKVLHLMDCYLPETMNWINAMLAVTSFQCEHHLAANYEIEQISGPWKRVPDYSIRSKYPIPWTNKVSRKIREAASVDALKKYIGAQSIDILHIHFGNILCQHFSWIKEMDIPICCSLYGYDYEHLVRFKPRVLEAYVEMGKREKFCFIVEGSYSKNLLHRYGIDWSKLKVVRMLFERVGMFSIKKYQPPIVLLQAATYTEKKNQIGLVEAIPRSLQGKLRVEMYGEIKDKQYYKALMRAVRSRPHLDIRVNSKLSLGSYLRKLEESHFAVNLSRRAADADTEGGCPMFIKDALVSGRPVLSTRHCDIPEWVWDGYNGWLVPEFDVAGVKEVLGNMVALSQKEYCKLARQAYEVFRYHAKTNQCGHELIEVYNELVCES